MSRRSFIVALALVLGLFGAAGLALYLVVGYQPELYTRAVAPTPENRTKRSQEFLAEFSNFFNNVSGTDRDWYNQFSDEQVNSYLDEGFIQQGLATRVLPDSVTYPHVVFEQDKIHVAFRYRTGGWSTVISIDLRVWLAGKEANALALELEGLRAGALPISGQWLMEELAKAGRKNGFDVTWYRLNGHPVALVRFQADQPHPTLLLQDVHLDQGQLTIRGRSPDAVQHAVLLQLPEGVWKPIAD
jgi:hypothetical protein